MLAAELATLYTGHCSRYIGQNDTIMLLVLAPDGPVTSYDQRHLAMYAALLDASAQGTFWKEAAANLMGLNPEADGAERCWSSHLERARWIVSEGLAEACSSFGSDRGCSQD